MTEAVDSAVGSCVFFFRLFSLVLGFLSVFAFSFDVLLSVLTCEATCLASTSWSGSPAMRLRGAYTTTLGSSARLGSISSSSVFISYSITLFVLLFHLFFLHFFHFFHFFFSFFFIVVGCVGLLSLLTCRSSGEVPRDGRVAAVGALDRSQHQLLSVLRDVECNRARYASFSLVFACLFISLFV
jgi:hypothetical protein